MAGWKGQSRGGKAGYSVFIFLINHLGLGAAYTLLAFVALYFIPAAPKSTSDTWRYARRVLGYGYVKSAWLVYRNYFAFGQSIIDRTAISAGMQDKFHFEFDGLDGIVDALGDGKGVITIGAHFGNWAAGEPFFREYCKRLNLVMFDNEHSDIKKILENNRAAERGFKIIPVNADNLAHIFMITDALRKGEAVSFLGDRYVNEDKLLAADFMGRTASFPAGPYILAGKMGVPVFFYMPVRRPHRTFRFRFVRADIPAPRSVTHPEQQILGQFISVLEEEMCVCPEQWYNYFDFWKFRKR